MRTVGVHWLSLVGMAVVAAVESGGLLNFWIDHCFLHPLSSFVRTVLQNYWKSDSWHIWVAIVEALGYLYPSRLLLEPVVYVRSQSWVLRIPGKLQQIRLAYRCEGERETLRVLFLRLGRCDFVQSPVEATCSFREIKRKGGDRVDWKKQSEQLSLHRQRLMISDAGARIVFRSNNRTPENPSLRNDTPRGSREVWEPRALTFSIQVSNRLLDVSQ